jgi:hypothetical protein
MGIWGWYTKNVTTLKLTFIHNFIDKNARMYGKKFHSA